MKRKVISAILMLVLSISALAGCAKEEEIPKAPEKIVVEEEKESEDKTVESTGIRICIDPGHYSGANVLQMEDGTSYCEGDVTLLLALKLREVLEEEYGIEANLTRDSGTITLGGYSNGELDNYHLALRGEAAAGYDMFLSVHTNANNEGANGYPTCEQPISINKPVVLINMVARQQERMLNIANGIGTRLAGTEYELGVADKSEFQAVAGAEEVLEWTDAYNDSLDTKGTVCVRTNSSGEDYYGVLRGASNVGVPGMIVEHGFHTVPEVRAQIASGELITRWAEADAAGIAEGFGIR